MAEDRNEKGQFLPGNASGRRFQPGQSGNPNGTRGPKVSLSHWYRKIMAMSDEELAAFKRKDGLSQGAKAAIRFVETLVKGDTEKHKIYLDRIEGPVRKEITGLGGEPLFRPDLRNLNDEQLAQLKAILVTAGVTEDDPDSDAD